VVLSNGKILSDSSKDASASDIYNSNSSQACTNPHSFVTKIYHPSQTTAHPLTNLYQPSKWRTYCPTTLWLGAVHIKTDLRYAYCTIAIKRLPYPSYVNYFFCVTMCQSRLWTYFTALLSEYDLYRITSPKSSLSTLTSIWPHSTLFSHGFIRNVPI